MRKFPSIILLLLLVYKLDAQYKEEQLEMAVQNGVLKGSLFVPDSSKQFPLVIIVAGSGPTDRYGNNMIGKSNSYRLLAIELSKQKIGSLLFDKRGIGGSASSMTKEADLRFDDYVNDLMLWIQKARDDKRCNRIIIAGHSEGSLIGMIAVTKIKVDAYVSLAGASKPIDEVVMDQLAAQPDMIKNKADSCFKILKKGQLIDSVPPYLMQLFRPSVQPYMISWMKYNPCTLIQQVKVPVMIVQGTTDIQVKEEEGKRLYACKPGSKFVLINQMNHVLKMSSMNQQENIATYRNPDLPVSVELTEAMVKFINP